MTDRQQLERLMAMVKQARDPQHTYFRNRKSASAEHVKVLLNDAKMKENSLDTLVAQLEKQGFRPNKHEGVVDQSKLF